MKTFDIESRFVHKVVDRCLKYSGKRSSDLMKLSINGLLEYNQLHKIDEILKLLCDNIDSCSKHLLTTTLEMTEPLKKNLKNFENFNQLSTKKVK